ncbi:MAG TPA: phage holin family protein [Myxococcales bacterium]|nr:phage holin family protein [Myxococcales bacterium]
MDYDVRGDGRIHREPTGKLVHDFLEESKRVLADGKRLLHSEVESAKSEIRREAKKAGPAAGMAGAGGVLVHVAVIMLALTIAAALSLAMDSWLACLITTVVFGIAGGVFLASARARLRSMSEIKDGETIHRLEEDQRWAKGLTQNVRSNLRRDT